MKYHLLALALLATPASAGTIRINIGSGGNPVYNVSSNVPDADVKRLIAFAKSTYGQIASGPADPTTGIIPMRDRTDAEALDAWWNGIIAGTNSNIVNFEGQTATKALPPITPPSVSKPQ